MTSIYIYIKKSKSPMFSLTTYRQPPKQDSNRIYLEHSSQEALTSTRFPSALGMGN